MILQKAVHSPHLITGPREDIAESSPRENNLFTRAFSVLHRIAWVHLRSPDSSNERACRRELWVEARAGFRFRSVGEQTSVEACDAVIS